MEPEQVAGPAADAGAIPPPAQQLRPRTLTSEEQPASPEEQELYDRFVSRAYLVIYDENFFPQVVEMLRGEGDPIEGLARTAAMVIERVMNAAEEAGQRLPGDVLFHAGKEVFEDLADLSGRSKVKDYSDDPDSLEGAFFRALDHLRVDLQNSGAIDREEAGSDFAMLEGMNQSGELEALFMDLAAKDEGGAPSAPQPGRGAAPNGGGLMPKEQR